jgi:glycosyltransferase involved in cell wall biosynthesis
MSENSRILYTGSFRFPDKDAAAFRVLGVAELFEKAGYLVDFAGWEAVENNAETYNYRGHRCYPQDEFRTKSVNSIFRLLGFFFRGHKTIKWLVKNRLTYSILIVYNPPAFFACYIWVFCKLSNIRLILDSTEWYESEHLPGGRYGLAAIENWLRMRLVYKLFSNIVTISEYLKAHYKNVNAILIPPLRPTFCVKNVGRSDPRKGLNLIYAGEVGKKDKLLSVIEILPYLSETLGINISMSIVGMTNTELTKVLLDNKQTFDKFRPFVNCLGRMSRKQVFNLYSSSHFSVLFRDKKRYAMAGFPTKAMESLVHGCPLITNAIGDLSHMLTSHNSIVLEENLIYRKLPSLIHHAINENAYDAMCSSAEVTGMQHFDPSIYQQKFNIFLSKLV